MITAAFSLPGAAPVGMSNSATHYSALRSDGTPKMGVLAIREVIEEQKNMWRPIQERAHDVETRLLETAPPNPPGIPMMLP